MLLQWNSSPAFTHGLIKSFIPSKGGSSSLQIDFAQSKGDADPTVPKRWPSQCHTAPEQPCPFTCVPARHLRLSRTLTPITPFNTSIQLGSAFRHLSCRGSACLQEHWFWAGSTALLRAPVPPSSSEGWQRHWWPVKEQGAQTKLVYVYKGMCITEQKVRNVTWGSL